MDSKSSNLYERAYPTVVASSPSSNSDGISGGGGEEVDELVVADVIRLNLKETVGHDQCSKGDFGCRICGSHAVKHVGGSRDCRRLRETKQRTLHMLGVLGVPWVDLHRSEFFGPYNFEEKKKVSNSEKNVSTKNKGKKVSTKKKGKKSSDKGKEKKSSDSD